ncbi:MAG: MFS transporter, partial [Solirubrobacterales bacterium]
GLGPMMWLLNSEVYPLHVRGKAAGLGTSANWFANFVVALTFPLLVTAIDEPGTFGLYAAISAFALVFVWRVVPETRGKTLEEIQEIFRKRAGAA